MKDIASDFANCENTGESVSTALSQIVNDVVKKTINTDKLTRKLELHPRPENVEALQVQKCIPEIWSEMILVRTRSKDLKIQKLQSLGNRSHL